MALITRDPNVINNIDKGGKHDTPSMTLFRAKTDELAEQIAQEIRDRIAGDNELWAGLRKEIADRIADVAAEKLAREQADNDLNSALDKEIQDRTDAVTAEKSAREQADAAEKAAREQADNDLNDALAHEIQNRTAADDTLQGNIDNEATARANADTAINNRITNLKFSDINGMLPGTRVYAY